MNPALPKTEHIRIDGEAEKFKEMQNSCEERKSGVNPALPDRNWYYVYLLRSSKTQWIYIGCTNDLENRLKEHNEGKVYSTKRMLPIELIYYEAYTSKDIAYKREKNLKSYGSGLAGLKLRLGIKKKGSAG